jgi:predicted porin
MKASTLCACLAAACPTLALAGTGPDSGVTIYGNFDEYIGYIRSDSGAHVLGLNDGAILRSRLGFRGAEDLGNGWQVRYTLELGHNADTGTSAESTRLFDRQAWIGIETPVGELRLGRQNTDIFLIGGAIDYTERTTFGSVLNTFGVPSRYENDVSFKTVRRAGLQASVHYALPENDRVNVRGRHPVVQLAVDWQGGPWRAGYAGLRAWAEDAGTVRTAIRYDNAYLDYKYGRGTLYAAVLRSNNSTNNVNGWNAASILSNIGSPNNGVAGTDPHARRFYNIWQLSADYRVTPRLRVGALYGRLRDMSGGGAGATGCNAGAYYELSKRTTLYGFASRLANEVRAGFRFSSSAAPSANLAGADVNGRTLAGLQLGILHRF